jgi:hypothetical protein
MLLRKAIDASEFHATPDELRTSLSFKFDVYKSSASAKVYLETLAIAV